MKLYVLLVHKFLFFFFLAFTVAADAQVIRSSFVTSSANSKNDAAMATYKFTTSLSIPLPYLRIKRGGFNLSRLKNDELKKWKAIEKIALQKGKGEEALYPTLNNLWRWASSTEHTVVIEIFSSTEFQSNSAASLSIESYDPLGQSHTLSLKLFLNNIDNALISSQAARKNGFIAFQFLKKEERYAEVLGHELSHAKYILTSNLRTRLVKELVEATNEIILFNAHEAPGTNSPFLQDRISQRDALLKELEAEAEANEEIIWKELVRSKKK